MSKEEETPKEQQAEQSQQAPQAPQAQNINRTTVITYFSVDGKTYIVSIINPNGKTRFFGNGIGKIVPNDHITRAGSIDTPSENRKKYTLRLENGKCNVYLDGPSFHTFDEIFGLPDGTLCIENISFHQFKYVPTADDDRTEQFRQLLGQLVSAYPDRFCLEDPKKQMEVREGGTKIRIPQPMFDMIKQLLIRFGVSTCSFVEHLENGSNNGVFRGDMDLYVFDAKEAERIITILTTLGFVKDSTDKSNASTFRLYIDVLCEKFSHEAIIPHFNLPEGLDPAQYYIEVEIKIATEFQKAYESNCLGYFLGLLLSYLLKISTSGISLKHGCDEIPINVGSFDDFLKKLGINLDGIRTTREFIERLLASPLISELLTVSDILRLFKNIMGDEKMKHTSKPIREWFHLLLCGLKERFPDRFSSLRSELIQEMFQDEKSGQMIPVWSVRLFLLNHDSESEVQMEKGVLSIMCSGKKLFVSTGADGTSLIFSEKQLKSDSGKQALPESMKVCSRLFELLKDYFDYLKENNSTNPIIQQFIDALGCRSEVGTHLGKVGRELMEEIFEELMKPLYSVIRTKPTLMTGVVYGGLMKEFKPNDIDFSQFEEFCVKKLDFVGNYNDFFIQMLNHQIFSKYSSRIDALSQEEHKQKRGEIYTDAMHKIENLCLDLVRRWTSFHNSDVNWTYDGTRFRHTTSQTYHDEMTPDCLPFYLGTSVLQEVQSDSLPSKGKKPKVKPEGKPEGKPAPEEKPQGKPVHVFMDCQTGVVFTVPIAE